jgi:hypothetical protein
MRGGRIEEVATTGSGRSIHLDWIGEFANIVHSLLQSHANVVNPQTDGNQGTFEFTGNDEELAKVLADLVIVGVQVVSFTERKQSVEDIYLKISHHEVM